MKTKTAKYYGDDENAANRDPITGAPGSHPVGTGVGAAGGGVAGAAVGAVVGGPVGAVIGAAVGAVAGGAGGRSAAEAINPTIEDAYWRENYIRRDYVDSSRPYDYYRSAYKYGWEGRQSNPRRAWSEVESDLERGWDRAKGTSALAWPEAKRAAKDAWHRVERALPGDADRDGR